MRGLIRILWARAVPLGWLLGGLILAAMAYLRCP